MSLAFLALGVAGVLRRDRPPPAGALSLAPTRLAPPFWRPRPASSSGPPAPAPQAACGPSPAFAAAAQDNASGLTTLAVAPFGVGETGWAAYAPLVAREIGVSCDPSAPGFAAALARWQAAHGLSAAGRMDAATLSAFTSLWVLRRPFVLIAKTACPPPPDPVALAPAAAAESFGGKLILARATALAAFRRMAGALRAELPAAPPLRIASAYRGPDEEAARCADGGCGAPGKARCSAHRTGLAFDLLLDAAAGADAFSTDPANRLRLAETPTYRWLVANADRFGFVNYPYEPWHWEWTGEPV